MYTYIHIYIYTYTYMLYYIILHYVTLDCIYTTLYCIPLQYGVSNYVVLYYLIFSILIL